MLGFLKVLKVPGVVAGVPRSSSQTMWTMLRPVVIRNWPLMTETGTTSELVNGRSVYVETVDKKILFCSFCGSPHILETRSWSWSSEEGVWRLVFFETIACQFVDCFS